MSAGPDVDAIVGRIRQTAKYAPLCRSVVERAARQAADRYRNGKDAEKAARRRLHQIYGAYLDGTWLESLEASIAGVGDDDRSDPRSFCRPLLDLHASTRERAAEADDLFVEIFARTGQPSQVLDLACGLNPIAIPWMGLSDACRYTAVDLHAGLTRTLRSFFEAFGVEGEAACGDVLEWSDFTADVVLMLKVLPCLARQEKDADLATIRRIGSPWVVVSYPRGRSGGVTSGWRTTTRGGCGRLQIDVGEKSSPSTDRPSGSTCLKNRHKVLITSVLVDVWLRGFSLDSFRVYR